MARNNWLAPLGVALVLQGCSTPGIVKDYTLFDLVIPRKSTLSAPANLPPADYAGEFWIDKKGCIFIRTDSDEWLPQVDIDRKPICDPDKAGVTVDNTAATASVDPTPRVFVDPETGAKTEVLADVKIPESYVQVGTFQGPENASAVRGRFAALGFPLADYSRRSGATTVLLGPFTVRSALDDALQVAKSQGFPDAFTFQN